MLKECILFVELWTLQLIRSCLSYTLLLGYCILEETSQEYYCCIGVDYAAVGLNLFKIVNEKTYNIIKLQDYN